jgi:hypothetical protein
VKSLESKKLVANIQKDLAKNGIEVDKIVADLKVLRPYANSETEKDPLVHKTIRLVCEHLEANGTFNIPIPEEDEEGNNIAVAPDDEDDSWQAESLNFFLSLIANSESKVNRPDITAYKFSLLAYAEA